MKVESRRTGMMDKITQQNAAQAEESASASEQVMGVVNNLMQLVENSSGVNDFFLGGAPQIQTHHTVSNSKKLPGSDGVLHQIALGGNQQAETKVAPEQIIPMDDEACDEDLEAFNQ